MKTNKLLFNIKEMSESYWTSRSHEDSRQQIECLVSTQHSKTSEHYEGIASLHVDIYLLSDSNRFSSCWTERKRKNQRKIGILHVFISFDDYSTGFMKFATKKINVININNNINKNNEIENSWIIRLSKEWTFGVNIISSRFYLLMLKVIVVISLYLTSGSRHWGLVSGLWWI